MKRAKIIVSVCGDKITIEAFKNIQYIHLLMAGTTRKSRKMLEYEC